MTTPSYAAIEAGGTKFVCALGDADGALRETVRIATGTPERTLGEVAAWLRAAIDRHGAPAGIGVGSFGPLELRRDAVRYGHLLRTPKAGWSGVDLLAPLRAVADVPLALDTDVNAAALAEAAWGAGAGLRDLAYVTVGTGIGVGALVDGRPLHGLLHPEAGHLRPRRPDGDAAFAGVCPFHGDCFEGAASGPALVARLGGPLSAAPPDHPVWALEADYLGQLCAQIALLLSPRRIVLGGGVLQPRLYAPVRKRMRHWLGGYLAREEIDRGIDAYIVPPALGDRSGVLGALRLAVDATRTAEPARG